MLLYEPNAVLGIRSRSHFFYQCTYLVIIFLQLHIICTKATNKYIVKINAQPENILLRCALTSNVSDLKKDMHGYVVLYVMRDQSVQLRLTHTVKVAYSTPLTVLKCIEGCMCVHV